MAIYLREISFDPWAEIHGYQDHRLNQVGKYGALASFIGTLRDHNQGAEVQSLELEHYPRMAEQFLNGICVEAARRWPILDSLIIHRHGHVVLNDTIVLIAVWSVHRAAAFDACRYLTEELKVRAPFWKQEALATGRRWVRPG